VRALIQRVKNAQVTVDEKLVGKIEKGLLVFLGVAHGDNEQLADKLLHKILHYRIFSDEQGKMNRNVQEAQGSLLIVSQFTIMAETNKGLRPSFTSAALPAEAERLYKYFVTTAGKSYQVERVAAGQFAADMQVTLQNDGPVTFMLEVS
jgi:D-tyrosyl-tRNA(Tyr) deacylase